MPPSSSDDILELLVLAEVEFVVVGMAAAVLQGAPMVTADIDIVHRRTPENVDRLLGVLRSLDAVYRIDPRRPSPQASHLLGPGHHLLTTRLGDLDCLGTIGNPGEELGYEELLPDAVELSLGEAHVRVLALEKLIAIKRRAGRPKDLAVLPALAATLDELRRRDR